MANSLNTEVPRYEAPRKVAGNVRYAADFMPAGMLYGELVVSAIAKGTLTAIDIEAARKSPGVIAVFTHDTLPKFNPPKGFYAGGPGTASFWPMTGTEIRYGGQPVAYVVAENAAAARRGAGQGQLHRGAGAGRDGPDQVVPGRGRADVRQQGQRRRRHRGRRGGG